MKIVVITATYNEKGNVERLIEILQEEVFPKIKSHQMSILVADDNSPDGTADSVRGLMKKWKNIDISSGAKKGLGAAYLRSIDFAIKKQKADLVFEIDADLSHDPREIPNFIKKIEQGYDVVTGTRYSSGGSMPANWPVVRKAFSIIGNSLVRIISSRFFLHDWTGGFRAIKKEVFLKEKEKMGSFQGYTFQVAFLYKSILDGYKIGEVPIHFKDRTLGRSKIAPLEYMVNLLSYVFLERIREVKRFVKFMIIGGSGFILQITSQELSVRIGLASAIALWVSPFIVAVTNSETTFALRDAIAGAIGAETAILSNFFWNNYWTFKDTRQLKEKSHGLIRLLKFNLTSMGSIIIQATSIWIFVHLLGEHVMIGGIDLPTRLVVAIPTIVILIVPLNYLIYNKIIWKTQFLKK
jgi:dolichol-phosphate mannosyltransferase